MDARLIQQTSQKLILSPQIRQYLKLLQLPAAELQQTIETELAENPVLEEKGEPDLAAEPGDKQEDPSPEETRNKDSATEELQFGDDFDRILQMGESLGGDYQDLSYSDPRDSQKIKNFQEMLLSKPQELSDFLLWQVGFLDLTPLELKIAEQIIGSLNEDGYLTLTPEEIASEFSASLGQAAEVLTKLQELDPPGVCARNLREALLIQLNRQDFCPDLPKKIISEHFSLFAKRDWTALSKQLSVPLDVVKKASDLICSLEPRPGRIFYQDESISVAPDATVTLDEDDEKELHIEVHDEYIPELRISPYYRRLLRSNSLNREAKNFIREKIQSAFNFMNALKLRHSTLKEITEQIIKMQPDFFFKGFSHLKPMRLKDIAQALNIHESTVSRALSGKYIATPQGMIPFKSFFSSKLETQSGEDESQKSIMEKIRQLIHEEDPKKPLSDQRIVRCLSDQGIKIARRTVTKYRELLKMLPSHLRRQTG